MASLAKHIPDPCSRWLSQSLKFGFRFHRYSLCGKLVTQKLHYFFWFLDQIVLELELKTFRC